MNLIGQRVNLIDKDGAHITNTFFKAEPQRFCVIHLTFPHVMGKRSSVVGRKTEIFSNLGITDTVYCFLKFLPE